MVEFKLVGSSSASAEDVIAAAQDFSRRRIEVWPNVSSRRYEVHAKGETFTEVTEAALQGFVWERSRYEWSSPGTVRQTVIDSNVLAPGCTWEITATPNGSGCHVECVFRRTFKHTPGGLFAWAINRFGTRLYDWDLRRALATIEN